MKLKLNWRREFRFAGAIETAKVSKPNQLRKLGRVCTFLFTIGCSLTSSAVAAERLSFRVGPFERSVSVSDLEQFAKTGELAPELKPYKVLLTPQVKQILSKSLRVDPSVADTFFDELFSSTDGRQLVEQLLAALPGSTPKQIKEALSLAVRQADDLSVVNFLQVYPSEELSVNLPKAAGIALQLNTSYLQSKILAPKLKKDLKLESNVSLPSFDPSMPGNESVFKRTFVFQDKIRERTIPVDLYYSVESQGPLVVMSHGFAADRKFLTYLALHLASYGLTVASVEHSGSNVNSLLEMSVGVSPNDLLPASEFIDRPKDITFVLNELERVTRDKDYLKRFNTQRVVVIGHSFGGYTALSLAGAELNLKELRAFCQQLNPLGRAPADWLQCAAAKLPYSKIRLRDRRVERAIAFNPIIGNIFGEQGLAKVDTPTLLLSSSDDAITPTVAHQLRPFRKILGEKYLLSVVGGTHMSVTDMGNSNSPVGRSTLVRELMGKEAEPIRQAVRGLSLAFIQLQTDSKYQPFLSPAYIQSLSTSTLSLRLSTELPLSTRTWLNALHFGSEQITLRKPKQEGVLAGQVQEFLASARKILPQPQHCFGQLDRIFTGFLSDYNQHADRLS